MSIRFTDFGSAFPTLPGRFGRLTLLVFAILMLGLGPSLATGAAASVSTPTRVVTFVNQSSDTIDLAIAKKGESPCGYVNWYLAGWWTLNPGESTTMRATGNHFYYHGSGSNGGVWDGRDGTDVQIPLYVSSGKFERCSSASGDWYAVSSGELMIPGPDDYEVQMARIDLTSYRDYTYTFFD